MPHHTERPPTTLAHGPAKPNDIERVRHDVGTAKASGMSEPPVEQTLGQMEAACQALREDVGALRRTIESRRET